MAIHIESPHEVNIALCGETHCAELRLHPGEYGYLGHDVDCPLCKALFELEKRLTPNMAASPLSPAPPEPVDSPKLTHVVATFGGDPLCGTSHSGLEVTRESARGGVFYDCLACRAMLNLESRLDTGYAKDHVNPALINGEANPWLGDHEPGEGDNGTSAMARRITLLERHVSALSLAMGAVWLNLQRLSGRDIDERFYQELERMAEQGELCVPSFDGGAFSYSVTGRTKPRTQRSLWSLLSGLPDPPGEPAAPSAPKKDDDAQEGA